MKNKKQKRKKKLKKRVKNILLKLLIVILIFNLPLVGTTNAFLSDRETSNDNTFTASSLDFSLRNLDDSLLSSPLFEISDFQPGDSQEKSFKVKKESGLDFQYQIEAVKTAGDNGFCQALNIETKLEGITQYTGSLLNLGSYPSLAIGGDGEDEWDFILSFDNDDSAFEGKNCQFDFVFYGWQTGLASGVGFSDQEKNESNSVTAGWWIDDEAPESGILGLDFSQTSHDFSIDYWAEDFPSSGVKEVALYYSYTFDLDDWHFFGTDVPDEFGEGSFEFTSPFGDGLYYFKTIATDNAGNVEDKEFEDTFSQVDTQPPITTLSLGEFGSERFASQEILANGNFEDTNDPEFGWYYGGDGDHKAVSDPTHSGDNSFLIGFRDTDLSSLSSLPAKDFLYQDIDLVDHSSATLSFWYRLETEDILDFDWFHALIKDPGTGEVLAKIVHHGSDSFRGDVVDFGWKEVTESISQFVGQVVRLYFEVENAGDTDNKTWAYLDDIRITKGDNYLTPDKEISFESSDASGSGVLKTEYKVDDGAWQEYIDPFTLDEGSHNLSYRSEDFEGWVEDEKTIDLEAAPSEDFSGVVLNKISARPSGSDSGSSGVPLDGEWIELWNNGVNPVDVNGLVLYDADEGKLPISTANADNDADLNDTGETIVPAGDSLTVYRNGDSDFTLNDDGDTVELYTDYKTSSGVLIDSFDYSEVTVDDKIWQRIPDGTGIWADPKGEDCHQDSSCHPDDPECHPEFISGSDQILNQVQNDGKDAQSDEEVNFFLSKDRKSVNFEVKNISQYEKLSYEITYHSDQGEQGIKGEIEIKEADVVSRENLKLGTCSSQGKVCTYHTGIKEIKLKIILSQSGSEDKISKKKLNF